MRSLLLLKKSFQCLYTNIKLKKVTLASIFIGVSVIFSNASDVYQNMPTLINWIIGISLTSLPAILLTLYWQTHRIENRKENSDEDRWIGLLSEMFFYLAVCALIGIGARVISHVNSGAAGPEDILAGQEKIKEAQQEARKSDEMLLAGQEETQREIKELRSLLEEMVARYPSKEIALNDIDNKEELIERTILDISHIPGVVDDLREKGGQAIIDRLLEKIDNGSTGKGLIEAHKTIMKWAYLIGNIEQAKKSVNIILAHDPNDIAATNQLGHIYFLEGNLGNAEMQYQNIIKHASGNKEILSAAYSNIGNVHQTRGELDQAMESHNKSLALNEELGSKEGMAANYTNIGIVHKTRGELDQAIESQNKALSLNQALCCL